MKKELGSSFSFSLNWIIFLMSIIFLTVVFITDYYQIFNIKETVDTEFKRSLSKGLIEYANDEYGSDYIAKLESQDIVKLEEAIRKKFVKKLKTDYDLNLTVNHFSIKDTGKIICKYSGNVIYRPMLFNRTVGFTIPVTGRSKIQRLDVD